MIRITVKRKKIRHHGYHYCPYQNLQVHRSLCHQLTFFQIHLYFSSLKVSRFSQHWYPLHRFLNWCVEFFTCSSWSSRLFTSTFFVIKSCSRSRIAQIWTIVRCFSICKWWSTFSFYCSILFLSFMFSSFFCFEFRSLFYFSFSLPLVGDFCFILILCNRF